MRRQKYLRMIPYLMIQTTYNLFSLVAYTTQTLTGTISFSLFPSLKNYTLENIALLHSVMVILKTSLHWKSILGYHLALMVLIILWG